MKWPGKGGREWGGGGGGRNMSFHLFIPQAAIFIDYRSPPLAPEFSQASCFDQCLQLSFCASYKRKHSVQQTYLLSQPFDVNRFKIACIIIIDMCNLYTVLLVDVSVHPLSVSSLVACIDNGIHDIHGRVSLGCGLCGVL